MEIGQMGCNFSLELALRPPPAIRLNRVTSKNANWLAFAPFFCTFWQKVEPSRKKIEPQTKSSGTQVRKLRDLSK